MSELIWQDRLCRVVDGTLFVSAVGDHKDFDFARGGKGSAFAIGLVKDIELRGNDLLVIPDDRIRLITGDPCDGGKMITFEA